MAHVLIASKGRRDLMLLAMLLEGQGHRATMAGDGQSAYAVLRSSLHPVVALLVGLEPEDAGYEAIQLLAGEPELVAEHRYILVGTPNDAVNELLASFKHDPWPMLPSLRDVDGLLAAIGEE